VPKEKEKEKLKDLVQIFSRADKRRIFNFTSGHLVALPLSDEDIRSFFSTGLLPGCSYIDYILIFINILIPYKNILISLRAILRKVLNTKPLCVSDLTLISLGESHIDADVYFGRLPKLLNVNYFKIVGGLKLKSRSYCFIESEMTAFKLFLFFILSPFFSLYFLSKLCFYACSIKKKNERYLFLILALKEIGNGTAFSQYILKNALRRHIQLNKNKVLIYPMEGRNWEKALNRTGDVLGTKRIGYLHCALTPKHFSLLDSRLTSTSEWPNIIITPGKMSYLLFKKIHPNLKVREGFFLRGNPIPANLLNSEIKVIIALTGMENESSEILRKFAQIPKKLISTVAVQLNTNAPSYSRLSSLAVALGFRLCDSRNAIRPEICFFRSSSVAVDYLRRGSVPIYINNNDIVESNSFSLDDICVINTINLKDNFLNDFLTFFENSLALKHSLVPNFADYYLNQDFLEDDLSVLISEVLEI